MDDESAMRQTRFSDVCGTLDELKRMLYEEPEMPASGPAQLIALVDDALFMLGRMSMRLREYEQFRDEFLALAAVLQKIESPQRQAAEAEGSALTGYLQAGRVFSPEERAEVVDLAEAIRDVAVHLEKALYRYKDVTLEIGRVYRRAKGDRGWMLDDADAQTNAAPAGEPAWMAWLPVSPHRERIVRYLHAGRAHLLAATDTHSDGLNPAPLIQFEDGGVIPLPAVRWSDELGNFYPADAPPHPRGLDYRDRRH